MILNLETDRLILRPFVMDDAARVQELAGDKKIAKTTLGMPHPYPIEAAENWIKNHPKLMEEGTVYPLAMMIKDKNELIGTMTLRVDKQHHKGELAYWVGKDYRGNGYATEAAKRMVTFGFEVLRLNRIWAMAMSKNPASVKVMKNVGMKYEGTLKQHIYQYGVYEDVDIYGFTIKDYRENKM
ncbi:GNAT family N-acetyltransferase [Bacillus smithii]|uniref:GNAT family N-acetyltransferase n=1 Tax=Bacillus smithii TaxID=1479 RepID=UPI003D1BFDAF